MKHYLLSPVYYFPVFGLTPPSKSYLITHVLVPDGNPLQIVSFNFQVILPGGISPNLIPYSAEQIAHFKWSESPN